MASERLQRLEKVRPNVEKKGSKEELEMLDAEIARLKAAEATPKKAPGESTWDEIGKGIKKNAIPSVKNWFTDLGHAIMNPRETGKAMADVAGGTIERFTTPVNQMIDQMIPLSEEDTSLSPAGEMADKFWRAQADKVRHPFEAFAEDPFGMGLDVLTLGAGGAGKIPAIAREATDVSKIAKTAKEASDAAFKAEREFGRIDTDKFGSELGSRAYDEGYRPSTTTTDKQFERGMGSVFKRDMETADLPTVRGWRKDLELRDEGGGSDSGLIGRVKDQFDELVDERSPEARDLMDAANRAFEGSERTKGLAGILERGTRKGRLFSRGIADRLGNELTRAIMDEGQKKNFGPEIVSELDRIAQMTPKPSGLTNTAAYIGSATAGAAGGYLGGGSALAGILGFGMGFAAPKIIDTINRASAAKTMTNELKNLIREINSMPPAQRRVVLKDVPPRYRAILLGVGAVGDGEQ